MLDLKHLMFYLEHYLYYPNFFKLVNWLVNNQYKMQEVLFKQQTFYLRRLIKYSYENVEFYHKEFKSLNLVPRDVNSIKDLSKLPLIDKNIIRNNYNQFVPLNLKKIKYKEKSTGGTTGTPLNYRITKYIQYLGDALTYRTWKRANYSLGDKVLKIGGSSIIPKKGNFFKDLITRTGKNAAYLDSFNLSESKFKKEITNLIKFRPKLIYGYPSAIEFFGKWLYNNGFVLKEIEGIVTTSEKLFTPIRKNIEKYFNTLVIDSYGLFDGGIGASECKEKEGLHIDTERGILEVVNDNNTNIIEQDGEIIATSLFNYAMPFIRYRTGDIGILASMNYECKYKINLPILKEIKGRTVDILITPEGNSVHGWFFLYIFWEYNQGIRQYKVEQNNKNEIDVYVVPEKNSNYKEAIKNIKYAVKNKVPNWCLNFIVTDKIIYENKRKFIINKIK